MEREAEGVSRVQRIFRHFPPGLRRERTRWFVRCVCAPPIGSRGDPVAKQRKERCSAAVIPASVWKRYCAASTVQAKASKHKARTRAVSLSSCLPAFLGRPRESVAARHAAVADTRQRQGGTDLHRRRVQRVSMVRLATVPQLLHRPRRVLAADQSVHLRRLEVVLRRRRHVPCACT